MVGRVHRCCSLVVFVVVVLFGWAGLVVWVLGCLLAGFWWLGGWVFPVIFGWWGVGGV